MDPDKWLSRDGDEAQLRCQDSFGKLLEMMTRLEEDVDPKFTSEQCEFFKSLITGLIDNIRSLKHEKKQ